MTAKTPSLYTYCIPYDDGAAPNPYWGTCTLTICKPAIRRTARVGDWVVGTGAKFARMADKRTRDLRGRVVYAMKVTEKLSMRQYDVRTRTLLKKKLPAWNSRDPRRWVGDSIYDFSAKSPRLRRSVHSEENRKTDLGGKYVLLSTHFYYFGDQAVPLPKNLRAIACNQQGHRRKLNEKYFRPFERWIDSLGHAPGSVIGKPLLRLEPASFAWGWCAAGRAEADEGDVEVLC